MEILKIEWKDMEGMCRKLGALILASGFKPDIIVGIARGGWIPARLLSDYLHNKNITSMRVEFYVGVDKRARKPIVSQEVSVSLRGKRVLLVDDVSDTGESLLVARKNLRAKGAKQIRVATLHYKPRSKFKPDYFVGTSSAWIVYPWETDETEKARCE
ncbi:MAG: phosphoribosyltransferase [Candidatus Micrarchaeota archaeon]